MPADTDLLSTAVHALWDSDLSISSAVPGELWTGEVPEGTTPPYAWLDIPDVRTTLLFIDKLDRARFTLHIYAIGAAQAEACAATVKNIFDGATLPFAVKKSVWCLPVRYRLLPEKARWKDGTLMYRAILVYDALIQIRTS